MPQATMLFAGLLTLVYLYLIRRVILARREYRQLVGVEPDQPELLRAIRAHGNFQEYTPLFLILLYLEESTAHNEWLCYFMGAQFLAGRLAQAYSLLIAEPRALANGARLGLVLRFRFYGMVHTVFPLGILALVLIVGWAMA